MTLTLDPASARRRRDDVAGKALSLSIPDCQTLDDHGLLALILGRSHGNPDQLAGDLLARFGSLGAVAAADLSELTRSCDAGPAVLADLKILRECPSSKHLAQVWRGVNGERASSGVGF